MNGAAGAEEQRQSEKYKKLRKLHVKKRIDEIDLCRYCSKPYENPRLCYYLLRYIYIKFDDMKRKKWGQKP